MTTGLYTFDIPLDDADQLQVSEKITELANTLMRHRSKMINYTLQIENHTAKLTLRVTEIDRWHTIWLARKLAATLAVNSGLSARRIRLKTATLESRWPPVAPGEKRTPLHISYRPKRKPTMPDGRPWDHLAWLQDENAESESECST